MGSGASCVVSDQAHLFQVVQETYAAGTADRLDDQALFELIKAKLVQQVQQEQQTGPTADLTANGPSIDDYHGAVDDAVEEQDHVFELPLSSRTTSSTSSLAGVAATIEGVSGENSRVLRTADSLPAMKGPSASSSPKPDKRRIQTMKNVHDPTKYRRASIVIDSVEDVNDAPEFTTDVLVNPVTLKMMLEFCSDIPHAAERLQFWADIQHLRTLPSAQYTDKMLRKIYEKFLSPSAPTPICVPTEMILAIQKEAESPNGIQSAGIYLDAQSLCLRDLEKDVFPRFLKHKLFENMKTFCESKARESEENAHLSPREEIFTFHAVLSDDTKLRFLKSYCMENLTLENLLFHMEVEEAKRLPNQKYVHACARKLFETYLKPNAKKFVALPPEIHAEMTAKFEANALDGSSFTDVQYWVLDYVRTDLWGGFAVHQPYIDHIHDGSLTPRHWDEYVPEVTETDVNNVLVQLETLDPEELIGLAMNLPMDQLANVALAHKVHRDTFMLLVHDKIAHKIFKKFLASRFKDHYVNFIDEVEEFVNLPGIEFMQHTAKKLFKKYLSENAKLQVDMSNKMRQDIQAKLNSPSIDMFRPAIVKVKTGLLQDSMVRYLKSPIHSEMKQDKEHVDLAKDLMTAVDKGKVDLPHLESVLANPKYLNNFRKYLKTQHAAENLIFLEEVDEFRRLPSYQIVVRSAKKILDKYINTNTSRSPIPIASHLHDEMVQNIDKAGKTFFSDAVQDVVSILRTTEVPEFLGSPFFMQLIGAWIVLDETYAIRQLIGEVELAFFKHVVPLSRTTRHYRAALSAG
ncbi:hypothetical protein AC1031_010804 [Aphanomyces cochlioides]|nr:hypothetical protein AC1031_010804 [Aphanomyces cochlioides]